MEHVTFDEFFDFVKNEDANWYIPGLKEYFEGLNQDEIYIQDLSLIHISEPTRRTQ